MIKANPKSMFPTVGTLPTQPNNRPKLTIQQQIKICIFKNASCSLICSVEKIKNFQDLHDLSRHIKRDPKSFLES